MPARQLLVLMILLGLAVPAVSADAADCTVGPALVHTLDVTRNAVLDPQGVYQLMGILDLGSDGATRRQIEEHFGACWVQASPTALGATRSSSSAVWISRRFSPSAQFEEAVGRAFAAQVFRVTFPSRGTDRQIQEWLSKASGGRLAFQVPSGTTMIAANVQVMNLAWDRPFDRQQTRTKVFFAAGGIERVPMMHRGFSGSYRDDRMGTYVELLLAGGGRMVVGLPKKEDTLGSTLASAMGANTQFQRSWIDLDMPRFEFASHTDMVATLKRFGVNDLFDSRVADMNPMFGEEHVAISDVFQDASIRVNEDGAYLASKSLAIVFAGGESASKLTLDHPFVFAIQDARGVTIAAGVVQRP